MPLYIQYCVQALRDEEEILALQDEAKRKAIASGTSAGRQIKQSSGNPIDAYDANGYTPLMRAVRSHDLKAVRDLLERGADPHVVDRDWGTSTALDFAKRELGKMNAPDARRTLVEIVAHIE